MMDLIRYMKHTRADSIEIQIGDYVINVKKKNKEKKEVDQDIDKYLLDALTRGELK